MIVKTEAIVLSKMKYRDSSKILRLYTREFGKISVIAKGARDTKSRFRSALESMNYVSCVIYKNEHRSLHLLSQCDVVTPFRSLLEDMEKMQVAMAAAELVDAVAHDEEQNEPLFLLLLDVLQSVNSATKSTIPALYFFETKLFDILGFKPELYVCSHCARDVAEDISSGASFTMASGGIQCPRCSYPAETALAAVSLRVLQRLQEMHSVSSALNVQLTRQTHQEIRRVLDKHLRHHVEGFRGLRSEEVFAAIL